MFSISRYTRFKYHTSVSSFRVWVLPTCICKMHIHTVKKKCNFTICSIFSNSGHVGWCTATPDTILKLDTLVMIQTKFGFHWSSTLRGEDFWKSLRRTTDDDDGRQVMAIAHLTLWVRWAIKGTLDSQPQVIKFTSCLPRVGGSLRVLRLPLPLKLVAMI